MELFVLGSFLVGSYNGVGQYHRFAAADAVTGPGAAKAISWVVAGGIAAAFIGPNLARYTPRCVARISLRWGIRHPDGVNGLIRFCLLIPPTAAGQ